MECRFETRPVRNLVLKAMAAVVAAGLLAAAQMHAASCPVMKHAAPTDADKAALAGDYAKAETLYRAALQKQAGDVSDHGMGFGR